MLSRFWAAHHDSCSAFYFVCLPVLCAWGALCWHEHHWGYVQQCGYFLREPSDHSMEQEWIPQDGAWWGHGHPGAGSRDREDHISLSSHQRILERDFGICGVRRHGHSALVAGWGLPTLLWWYAKTWSWMWSIIVCCLSSLMWLGWRQKIIIKVNELFCLLWRNP